MINNILLNFKQGQLADTSENINLLISKMEEQSGDVNAKFLSKNDYIKFHQNEVAGDNASYSRIIKDKDGTGEIEIIDTLDDSEKGGTYIVFLNDNDEICPIINDGMIDSGDIFVQSIPDNEQLAQRIVQEISTMSEETLNNFISQHPYYESELRKIKTITKYERKSIDTNPNKKVKVVWTNMFHDFLVYSCVF